MQFLRTTQFKPHVGWLTPDSKSISESNSADDSIKQVTDFFTVAKKIAAPIVSAVILLPHGI